MFGSPASSRAASALVMPVAATRRSTRSGRHGSGPRSLSSSTKADSSPAWHRPAMGSSDTTTHDGGGRKRPSVAPSSTVAGAGCTMRKCSAPPTK